MRNLAPVLLASGLLFGASYPATAADKIKIEIVESTMTIGLVPHTFPGTPERIQTHCNVLVDVNCNSTVTPATNPSSGLLPEILLFEAKAVLPDGSHVKLTCFPSRWNKKCKGIVPTGPNTSDSAKCFLGAVAAFASDSDSAGKTATCTTRNLGSYRAQRKVDELVIYGPGGKLEYRITGSW